MPLRRLFKDKTEATIFFAAFLVEIAFGLYLIYRWGFTFESGDSISHLYIASTVVNNGAQNSLANLGSVWLPMFHILVMPLVLIEPLYRTGFAGTIVSSLATGGICVILYRLLDGGIVGILSSFLFMVNAFTLFFGATPMMEQTAMFFVVLATYYFKNYWEKGSLIEFMKCNLALIFGTLTRYEVWAVALLVALFFIVREIRNGSFHRLAYVHFPFWGIFAWLFWNLAIFRDPLMFLHHPIGPSDVTIRRNLPYVGNLFLTSKHMFNALYSVSGALFLISLTTLLIMMFLKRWNLFNSIILLITPIPFQLYTMFFGMSGGWFRHFYPALPGIIVAPLLLIKEVGWSGNPKKPHTKIIALIFITILLYSISLPTQIKIINTGNCPEGDPDLASIYQLIDNENLLLIKETIGDNKILSSGVSASSMVSQTLLLFGIKPSQIIDDYDGELFIRAMKNPWKYCSIVLISEVNPFVLEEYNKLYDGEHYEYLYQYNKAWRSKFLDEYKIIFHIYSPGGWRVDFFKLVEEV